MSKKGQKRVQSKKDVSKKTINDKKVIREPKEKFRKEVNYKKLSYQTILVFTGTLAVFYVFDYIMNSMALPSDREAVDIVIRGLLFFILWSSLSLISVGLAILLIYALSWLLYKAWKEIA